MVAFDRSRAAELEGIAVSDYEGEPVELELLAWDLPLDQLGIPAGLLALATATDPRPLSDVAREHRQRRVLRVEDGEAGSWSSPGDPSPDLGAITVERPPLRCEQILVTEQRLPAEPLLHVRAVALIDPETALFAGSRMIAPSTYEATVVGLLRRGESPRTATVAPPLGDWEQRPSFRGAWAGGESALFIVFGSTPGSAIHWFEVSRNGTLLRSFEIARSQPLEYPDLQVTTDGRVLFSSQFRVLEWVPGSSEPLDLSGAPPFDGPPLQGNLQRLAFHLLPEGRAAAITGDWGDSSGRDRSLWFFEGGSWSEEARGSDLAGYPVAALASSGGVVAARSLNAVFRRDAGRSTWARLNEPFAGRAHQWVTVLPHERLLVAGSNGFLLLDDPRAPAPCTRDVSTLRWFNEISVDRGGETAVIIDDFNYDLELGGAIEQSIFFWLDLPAGS